MGTSLAATAGLVANLNGLSQGSQKKSNMKVGLYSITFLGVWYRGEALRPQDGGLFSFLAHNVPTRELKELGELKVLKGESRPPFPQFL